MKNHSNAGLFMPTSSIWNVGYGPQRIWDLQNVKTQKEIERLAKRIKTQKQIKYKHFNKLQLWKIQLKLQLVK